MIEFSLAYVYPKLYHGVSGHSQHVQSIIEAIIFEALISLTGVHYLDLNYNNIIEKSPAHIIFINPNNNWHKQ